MVLTDWFKELGKAGKAVVVLSGGIAAASTMYGAYILYKKYYNSLENASSDEFDEEERYSEKKVLVLGLQGAGKTTFLSALSQPESTTHREETAPTEGFNVVCLTTDSLNLNIWEIGGSKKEYWPNFIDNVNTLVFVVDASNPPKFQEAKKVLHCLLSERRLIGVPVLLVTTKNDVPGAKCLDDVVKALDLDKKLPSKAEFLSVSVQIKSDGSVSGLSEARDKIMQLCKSTAL